MQTQNSKKKGKTIKKKSSKQILKDLTNTDYQYVSVLAKKIRTQSDVLAKFISYVVAEITISPFSHPDTQFSRFDLLKGFSRIISPRAELTLNHIEQSLLSLQESFTDFSLDILKNTEFTSELIFSIIDITCSTLENKPQLIVFFSEPEILEEVLGELGARLSGLINIIPAFSTHAAEKFPNLKEIFFHSLFQLSREEREKLYKLAEEVMSEVYRSKVFPLLKKTLAADPRGKVLAPILAGAIEAIPGESCINAILSIACTPHNEFSNGRVIAIAIQEIGGLYIKISQIIAELCPPILAKELKTTQDNAGGIFPSIEKSWEYLIEILKEPSHEAFVKYLIIPEKPMRHFASASVGSLYNLQLNEQGKINFAVESVLIKIQRPNLKSLFAKQCNHILKLTDDAYKTILDDVTLSNETRAELLGLISTLRRAVLNYHKQSQEELDFTSEEKNAEKVRIALGNNHSIHIPRYFYSTEKLVCMECINGIKVTKIIQTKYLARRVIADSIAKNYLDLVFHKGVVWADPHPGNILYNYEDSQISMVDLNPCYVWDEKTREEFKHLIYRLILRDADGLYNTLYHLVENPESLHCDTIIDDLNKFLTSTLAAGSLTRFVGEFIKTLSENHIDLRVEVQAALRGLSQIALTSSSISVRNSFGSILRKYFRFREIIGTLWKVGIFRVLKVFSVIIFEFIRNMPEEDIGPVLDERDIKAIYTRTRDLAKANVCSVTLRRISPEDNPNLKMSQDGQVLLITSNLYIEILEKIRPARVRYVIEIPSKKWLKERQEFVKLSSIARSFCAIECLEELRRSSLDDYWKTVEAWGKTEQQRNLDEIELIAEINIAARKLYTLRFQNIWNMNISKSPFLPRISWKFLMIFEVWKEQNKQKYFISAKRKVTKEFFLSVALRTYYRIMILILEFFLWLIKKHLNSLRYSMHLLPLSSSQLEDLILYGLSRNFNHSFRNKL